MKLMFLSSAEFENMAEIKLAYLLSPHITLDISKLTNDIKKDSFLEKNSEEIKKRITQEENQQLKEKK